MNVHLPDSGSENPFLTRLPSNGTTKDEKVNTEDEKKLPRPMELADRIQEEVEQLHNAVWSLEQSLHCVLEPVPPVDGAVTPEEKPECQKAPLIDAMEDILENLKRVESFIGNVTRRLQM